jgi:putative membrane protein
MRREPPVLFALAVIALVASGIAPYDRFTWFLEVAPILIAAPLLLATHRRFTLTPLVQRLIFLHALVLVLGGAYTYARVPLGSWVADWLDLERNPYDRFGHLVQGFVPAMIAREVLLRRSRLEPGKWLFFLVTCVCLTVSVTYEFVEWWAAELTGTAAEAFLGTQGDPWDTQWDMFLALLGALAAQTVLARIHDRQLAELETGWKPRPDDHLVEPFFGGLGHGPDPERSRRS